ncbi:MAG: hypothetical protein IJR62_06035 [Lachnospiraceae bacterium]|jgi:hypothetical protein|nr:hypothetical protein [Lachnospiraceae bacterium]
MRSRRVLFRAGALLIVLLIAALMFVIGRGHTVYFDNKTAEYNGQTYEAFHKVVVTVDGEQVAKLGKRDRGMADTMGQKFEMTLEITDEKGAEPHSHKVSMTLPYGMDGIIVNLPELMAGLPADAYLSEFVIAPVEEEETEEETATDEFGIGGDI